MNVKSRGVSLQSGLSIAEVEHLTKDLTNIYKTLFSYGFLPKSTKYNYTVGMGN